MLYSGENCNCNGILSGGVEKGQRNELCFRVGKTYCNGILSGEVWERAV